MVKRVSGGIPPLCGPFYVPSTAQLRAEAAEQAEIEHKWQAQYGEPYPKTLQDVRVRLLQLTDDRRWALSPDLDENAAREYIADQLSVIRRTNARGAGWNDELPTCFQPECFLPSILPDDIDQRELWY